jgi:hypothetical protein
MSEQHNAEMLYLLDAIGQVCEVADAWGVLAESYIDVTLSGCQLVALDPIRRRAVLILDGSVEERTMALESLVAGQLQGLSGRAASAASEFRMDLYAGNLVEIVFVLASSWSAPDRLTIETHLNLEMIRLCRDAELSVVPDVSTVFLAPPDVKGRGSFGSREDLIAGVGDSVFDRALLAWGGDPNASRDILYAENDPLRVNSVARLTPDAVLAAWFLRGIEAISLGYTALGVPAESVEKLLGHRGAIPLLVAGIGRAFKEADELAGPSDRETDRTNSFDLVSDVMDVICSADAAASHLLLAVDRGLEDPRRVDAAIDRFLRSFVRSIDPGRMRRLRRGAGEYSPIIVSRFSAMERSAT